MEVLDKTKAGGCEVSLLSRTIEDDGYGDENWEVYYVVLSVGGQKMTFTFTMDNYDSAENFYFGLANLIENYGVDIEGVKFSR